MTEINILGSMVCPASRCSAWLGHPPRIPIKLVQTGNHLRFCFVICGVSFLLAFRVWASPTIETLGFVSGNRSIKSHDESASDAMPHFQNLSRLWAEHKITGGSGLYAADQHSQVAPEPLPLDGRITTNPNPLTNQNADESDEKSCENLIKHWWHAVVFFCGVAIGYYWPGWPNEKS